MSLSGITSSPNITSVLSEVDLVAHSLEIMYQAQPNLYYDQVAIEKTELGVQPGKTIRFLKMNDIDEGDPLVEGTRIVVDDISTGSVDVTVREVAKGVALTEFLLNTSAYDLLSGLEKLFADNYAKTVNLLWCKEIFQNAPNFLFGMDKANRAALTDSDVFSTDIITMLSEDMATRNVPKNPTGVRGMSASYYIFHHPRVAHQIKKDPHFEKAKLYGAPEDLFFGEIGQYDGHRMIETTYIPVIRHPGTYTPYGGTTPVTPSANVGHVFINGVNFTDRKPTLFPAQTIVPGQVIYQSVCLGARALAKAVAKPVEMRHNGIIDFEREREMAWLTVRGEKNLNPDRMIIIETVA